MKPCAYCGDEALFGRLDGSGPAACAPCGGLLVSGVEPDSQAHAAARPHVCPYCQKRTTGLSSCGREACLDKAQSSGANN